ncbi:MAG: type VI secretion system baseplate subunit TssG [Candidatus Zixiibacteriota bacterium]|nr:MAG: type VI secretion system baseplate subunit TssG [candidate division Zixibacteria bacterium]
MNQVENAVMPQFCDRKFPFRYTVALNILGRMGVSLDRVDLLALGTHENYKGEILGQEPEPGTPLNSDTRITLRVGKASSVDFMPYQFFYGLHGVTSSTGSWEEKARSLMAPFDAPLVRYDAAMEFEDLKTSFGCADSNYTADFLGLFNFDAKRDAADLDEMLAWATVFPTFNMWAGNSVSVCRVLQYLFGYQFEIRENTPMTFDLPEGCLYRLGSESDRLGGGLILGKSFTECDSGYEVIVRAVPDNELEDLLPNGRTARRIRRVLEICMPSHLEFRLKIVARPMARRIGRDAGSCYLGYSSHA